MLSISDGHGISLQKRLVRSTYLTPHKPNVAACIVFDTRSSMASCCCVSQTVLFLVYHNECATQRSRYDFCTKKSLNSTTPASNFRSAISATRRVRNSSA